MIRTWSVILGLGLIALWIVGLASGNSTPWLTWLDGIGGVFAFIVGGSVSDQSTRGARVGGNLALSIGLFALWIIGLASGSTAWQSWWSFAFACAFLLLSIVGGSMSRAVQAPSATSGLTPAQEQEQRERFRRSA